MDGEEATRYLVKASDTWETLTFASDALFNKKAPEPWVSFMIGGILSLVGFLMWLRRLKALKANLLKDHNVTLGGSVLFRAMISVAIDSDEPFYTIVSFSAFSFFFLAGLQLNYTVTFSSMLAFFGLCAFGDSVRVLLAFSGANSLADVVFTSKVMESKLRNKPATTELKPSNVYEDLGRGRTIVMMVFFTQVILISFVVTDIYDSATHSCRDGTRGCPVVGTFGSWGFYVLGIFMACVFLLGPKTSFGQSEQNPAYWLQLLLAAKKTGAQVTWYDPVSDKHSTRVLRPDDWRVWGRFFMSFLINGVGFHILVHALPIQVATQSSLTGVVFRAVGMMYLVDLDDTPGYTLRIVEEKKPEIVSAVDDDDDDDKDGKKLDEKEEKPNDAPELKAEIPKPEEQPIFTPPPPEEEEEDKNNNSLNLDDVDDNKDAMVLDNTLLSAEAQKIIDEAREKLSALARGEIPLKSSQMTGALLMAGDTQEEYGTDGDEAGNMLPSVAARASDVEAPAPTADAGGANSGEGVGGAE